MNVAGRSHPTVDSTDDQSDVSKKRSVSKRKVKVKDVRRSRTNFNLTQIEMMEKVFTHHSHFPDPGWIAEMSTALRLDPARIMVWFKNRRAKEKRRRKETELETHVQPNPPPSGQNSSVSSFNRTSMEKIIPVRPPNKPFASVQPQSSLNSAVFHQRTWEPVNAELDHTKHLTPVQHPSAPNPTQTRQIIYERSMAFNSRPSTSRVLTHEQTYGIPQMGRVTTSAAPFGGSYPSRMVPWVHHQPPTHSGFPYTVSPYYTYYSPTPASTPCTLCT